MRDIATATLSGNLTRDVELASCPRAPTSPGSGSPPPPADAPARSG